MDPQPEKKHEETVESAEDLRKILDEAGFNDVPVFELHHMIQHPESFADDIERIREGITKRLEEQKGTEVSGDGTGKTTN